MQWMQKMTARLGLDQSPRIRKVLVGVIGVTVLLIGFVLIVLPGPAFIVIPVGLVILASEFAWARSVLRRGSFAFSKVRRGKWRNALSRPRRQ